METELWFNKAGNTGGFLPGPGKNSGSNGITCYECVNGAVQGKSYMSLSACPQGETTNPNPCNTSTGKLVSCNACQNGVPVGVGMFTQGQCPPGSTENFNPCTPIQCYTCGAGNNPVAVGTAYPMDPYDGCNPTGNGPSTSNPDGGCSTNPPAITCYECLNGVAQGRSYIGMTTCPNGETTDPNPCTSTGPALQDDCYNCSSGFTHRVARGTCVNGVDVMVSQVDPNTGGSQNPCPTTQLLGCTDTSANNFNPLANTDDGSCTFTISGCTDTTALNYNPNANIDDGSCGYIDPVSGCTDMTADNYNPAAVIDDGSCSLPLSGCIDPSAENYNSLATIDDESCTFLDEELEEVDDDIKTAGLAGDNKMLMYIAIGIGVILLLKK